MRKNFALIVLVGFFALTLYSLTAWKQQQPIEVKPNNNTIAVEEEYIPGPKFTPYEKGYNDGFDAAFDQEKIPKENYGGTNTSVQVNGDKSYSDGYVQGYHEAMARINEKLVCPFHMQTH